MVKAIPERPDDGKQYDWNREQNKWIERPDRRGAQWGSFDNWVKTGVRMTTFQGEAFVDLGSGNFDKLAFDAENMSNVELALSIGSLIAIIGAGSLGNALGKRSAMNSIRKLQTNKAPSRLPSKMQNVEAKDIDTFIDYYNELSKSNRLKVLEQSVEYKQKQYQVYTEQARLQAQKTRSPEDIKAYNDFLKEGDEFVNNEYSSIKREVSDVAYEADKARSEEQALEREQERQQLETIDEARENDEVMNEWYEEFGTNDEGVNTDLQELGRRVMGMLDPDGLGEIELPQGSMGQYIFNNFPNSAEREAIGRAYNDPRIWNTLKANYKKGLATGAISVMGGVVSAVSNVDTNTIRTEGAKDKKEDDINDIIDDIEDEEDADMGLIEDVENVEERRERIEDEGVEDAEEGLGLDPNKEEEKEEIEEEEGFEKAEEGLGLDPNKVKGKDRLPPSGEPEAEAPTTTAKPSPDRMDTVKDTVKDTVNADVQDAQSKGESLPAVQENLRNVDELVQRCLELCKLSYRDKENFGYGYSWIRDDIDFPILFHETNRRLFVTFRGTQSWQNALTDLDLTSIGSPETRQEAEQMKQANFLHTFDNLSRHLTDQFSNIEMHQGFLVSLNEMYNRVVQKMSRYTVDEVIFTGHSAGGALCSMMYYVYQNDTRFNKLTVGNCVSFASPRFLFENYLDLYNINCPEVIRVFNLYDPVPYVPLHQPMFGMSTIADGYTHVGKSLCLNGKLTHNNPNRFIYNILKNGQGSLPQIMKLQKMSGGTNALIDFMLDTRYESALFDTTIRCLQNVSVKENVSKEMIASVVSNLNRDMEKIQEYNAKCMLAQPFGIADILQQEPLGESAEQQNFGIISRVLMAMLANLSFSKEHDLEVYSELLKDLQAVEIENKEGLFQAAGDIGVDERFVRDVQNRVQMSVPSPLGMIQMNADTYIGKVVEYQ